MDRSEVSDARGLTGAQRQGIRRALRREGARRSMLRTASFGGSLRHYPRCRSATIESRACCPGVADLRRHSGALAQETKLRSVPRSRDKNHQKTRFSFESPSGESLGPQSGPTFAGVSRRTETALAKEVVAAERRTVRAVRTSFAAAASCSPASSADRPISGRSAFSASRSALERT